MLVSRRGAANRKSALPGGGSTDADDEGNPAAIVVGAVLDGIPESVAIGISLLEGGHIGGVFVAAVFLSNIPESMSASAGLSKQGRTPRSIFRLWAVVVAASTLASVAGYSLLDGTSVDTIAFCPRSPPVPCSPCWRRRWHPRPPARAGPSAAWSPPAGSSWQ
jgi:ZIP family zinc transporter